MLRRARAGSYEPRSRSIATVALESVVPRTGDGDVGQSSRFELPPVFRVQLLADVRVTEVAGRVGDPWDVGRSSRYRSLRLSGPAMISSTRGGPGRSSAG